MCPDGPSRSSIRSPNPYIRWSAVSRLEAVLVSASGTTRLKTRAGINRAEAMVTVRRYWSLEGEVGRRSLSKRSQIGAFGAVRHMGRLDYFGIGPQSLFDDRSAFRLRETTFGTRGWFQAAPAVRVGGSIAAYMPDLGPGSSPSVRSIEEVFTPISVPGFDAEPTFGRYRGFVEFLHPVADPAVLDESDTLSRRLPSRVRGRARPHIGQAQFPSRGNRSSAAHSRIPPGPAA